MATVVISRDDSIERAVAAASRHLPLARLVRGKVVAGVCALPPCKMEIVDFLVSSVERAIEIFGLRLGMPLRQPVVLPKLNGSDDEKSHADARRSARLLVSEIKLYNEEELKAGRENHDIYRRLQKEIEERTIDSQA